MFVGYLLYTYAVRDFCLHATLDLLGPKAVDSFYSLFINSFSPLFDIEALLSPCTTCLV